MKKINKGKDIELSAKAAKLLAEASVLSEASAAALEPKTAKPAPQSSPPHIGGKSTYDHFADMFSRCKDEKQLERAVKRAEEELEALKGRKKRPDPAYKERVYWLLTSYEGTDYRLAAQETGLSPATVRAERAKHGRDKWGWSKP